MQPSPSAASVCCTAFWSADVRSLPRDFTIGRRRLNPYRVFLGIGIFAATLVSGVSAERAGLSPLAVGIGCLVCALAGIAGARLYHLVVTATRYTASGRTAAWDTNRGGLNVFGALLPLAPASFLVASVIGIPVPAFLDHLFAGVLVGGFWIRLGCVFNGCCAGRPTTAWYGVLLSDTRGTKVRRIPVQFMEMAWWALGSALALWVWPVSAAPGNLALAVLAWYGVARFFLETMREESDRVFGHLRIDRVVAAVVAIVAVAALLT
jgi:phosphatidylglycerol:prolipoprotein diacylglycerol transferase